MAVETGMLWQLLVVGLHSVRQMCNPDDVAGLTEQLGLRTCRFLHRLGARCIDGG